MARTCPDCRAPLERKEFKAIEIDACPRCAGIFFDEGEVNRLRAQGTQTLGELDDIVQPQDPPDPENAQRTRVCPSCTKSMRQYRYLYSSPIMLDSCDECGGVWVQNGELRRMQEYLQTEAPAKVAQVGELTEVQKSRATLLHRFLRALAH